MGCKSYTKRSTVQSTVILPEKWESSPWITRSVVDSCTFENLTDATVIHRSKLNAVTLREQLVDPNFTTPSKVCCCRCDGSKGCNNNNKNNNGSYIKFSTVEDSTVTDSNIKRSKVQDSTLSSVAQARWSDIRGSRITNVGSIKRCKVEDTVLQNAKGLKWATIKKSNLSDCTRIKRSTLQGSTLKRSIVSHASLSGCEVNDCAIYRTTFEGMILENGIWKHGALVGRIDETKDVVIRSIDEKTDNLKAESGSGIINITVEQKNGSSSASPIIPVTLNGEKVSVYRADEKKMPSEESDVGNTSDSSSGVDRDFEARNDSKILPPPPYKS